MALEGKKVFPDSISEAEGGNEEAREGSGPAGHPETASVPGADL